MTQTVATAMAVLLLGALDVSAPQASAVKFVLGPQTRWLTSEQLLVHYELVNVSEVSVYVSQFPGPSVMATCETEQGGVGGASGGVWSKDGVLARKYFLQLKPGEALMGETVARVPPECRRNLRMIGTYQMEDGDDWGFAVAGRRIDADPLPVPIERRPVSGPAHAGVTLEACTKGDEVVVHMTPRELPLEVTTGGRARSKPADGITSPNGTWVIFDAATRQHPAMMVWRGPSRPSVSFIASTMPVGRPIDARWLSADVVCLQVNMNPMATAAWLVNVRQGRVLAAGSLQAPPP